MSRTNHKHSVASARRDGDETASCTRAMFRRAFVAAGLPYFNPHSFRDMLVHHAMTQELTPEQMKAWSQNLGRADVLTTFTSYGNGPVHRQGELIRSGIRAERPAGKTEIDQAVLLAAIAKLMGNGAIPALPAGP